MSSERATVAVTGAAGFIGRNLVVRLNELGFDLLPLTRETPADDAWRRLGAADVVFHLAGANRPNDSAEFMRSNRDYTTLVAEAVRAGGKKPLVIYSSSTKADDGSEYGRSKRAGEAALLDLGQGGAATSAIFRLPNVFGKWARPHYNSAVATFCHNRARGLPIRIDDASAPLSLIYVDDLIDQWLGLLETPPARSGFFEPKHARHTTVGEVARLIDSFASGRATGEVGDVGSGFERALYATFVSALPTEAFSYPLAASTDPRGSFMEVLKTRASGQLSIFTAHPGVTRGGHYHHSKVEKFLIVHGEALFRFEHVLSGETFELRTSAQTPVVVETIPGWAHEVTNVGQEVMVSFLWANEVFDRERPDTFRMAG